VPHKRGNYDYMMEKMGEVINQTKKP
jgi:hypothetical protein